jgi:hypothetical protein
MSRVEWARWAPAAGAVLLLVTMVALSVDFGFTWDERFQQRYGEQVWDYLHGRVPRSDFDTDVGNQYLYGGLVELLCVAAQKVFPADAYVVRHAVNSVFGWLGVVFAGLLASRLFGVRAGWLAALLLVVSPRYFGDSMNNPKDIPFAAFVTVALYYTLTIEPRPPHLSWGHLAKLATAIALAINVRPLGVVLLGYAAVVIVATAAWAARSDVSLDWRRRSGAVVARLGVLTLVVLPAGTLAWPWAQAQPFVRPLQAFLFSSQANWASGFHVLYAGHDLGAGSLPWHYVPLWLIISLPPVVLFGLLLSFFVWRLGTVSCVRWMALATFAIVPIAGAIVRHATIYDGIRHLLFIVPPLTVLGAAGWSAALGLTGPRRAVAVAALIVGLIEPVVFQIRNHPNQIVYFSPLMGGPRSAFGRFDMDYWGNSMLQAVEWAARTAEGTGMALGVSGNPPQAVEADAGRFHSIWFARRESPDYHFDIRLLRGPRESVREFAARPDVLYRVTTADGTPLCVVLPGPAFGPLQDLLRNRPPLRRPDHDPAAGRR